MNLKTQKSLSFHQGIWVGCLSTLLFLTIFIVGAKADQFYLEGGVSQWTKPINGVWWLDGYDHTFKMKSPYLRVGFNHGLTDNWHVGVSAFSLGSYSIDALAMQSDGQECFHSHRPKSCSTLVEYQTRGKDYGLATTVSYRHNGWFLEGGPIYSRQSLQIDVSTGYHNAETVSGFGSMFGLGYDFGHVGVGLYNYKTGLDGGFRCYPSGSGEVNVLAVRIVI